MQVFIYNSSIIDYQMNMAELFILLIIIGLTACWGGRIIASLVQELVGEPGFEDFTGYSAVW